MKRRVRGWLRFFLTRLVSPLQLSKKVGGWLVFRDSSFHDELRI